MTESEVFYSALENSAVNAGSSSTNCTNLQVDAAKAEKAF